jgi:hypothetical protein
MLRWILRKGFKVLAGLNCETLASVISKSKPLIPSRENLRSWIELVQDREWWQTLVDETPDSVKT